MPRRARPGRGTTALDTAELATARRRISNLEEEVKILRKAAASVETVEPPKIATAWSQNSALTECGSGIAVISRVEELDRSRCRFAYETRNADGNPSYVKWAWEVVGAGTGAEVTVTWDCYLKTFDRRVVGGPLRKRQLAREVPKSLTVMASAVMATEPR